LKVMIMYRSGVRSRCRLGAALGLGAVFLLSMSCEQVDVTAVPAVRVEISPAEPVVALGSSAQLHAAVLSSDDRVLSGRRVTWSSDDETIATIDNDGMVVGMATGSTVISAQSEGVVGSVSVTITSAAAISLSPGSVEFAAVMSGASPGDRTVSITNGGGGTLSGLSASVRYAGGQPSGWLTVTLSGSAAPASLILSATQRNLPVGTYNATVDVAATTPGTSSALAVTLRVVAPDPAIGVSTTAISFTAAEGGEDPAPQTVGVTNAGGGTLSGLSTSVLSQGSWLTAQLAATTAPTTLTLRAQRDGLAPGSYSATVRIASNVAPNSPVDVAVTFTVTEGETQEAPEEPDDLDATARSDRRIDLSWDDESDDETEFQIRRATSGTDWVTIGQTGENRESFADTVGLAGSTTYEYAVRACNGASCSDWSESASATTAPAAPSGVTAAPSADGIVVTWTDNSPDETAFRIERRKDGGDWGSLATVAAGTLSFTDTNVEAGSTYHYRIAACRQSLCSTYSDEAQAQAPMPSGTPSTPSQFTGTVVSATQIDLSWQAPGGQTHYELRWRAGGKGGWTTQTINGSATSYSHTNLAPVTLYEYELRACAGESCSGYTSRIALTTPAG
jgi:hypothetical protein